MTQPSAAGADLPADVVELARRVGDDLLVVDDARRIQWSSTGDIAAGTALFDLIDPEDDRLLEAALSGADTAPVVLRMTQPKSARASVVAARREKGWLVQVRRPRAATPRAAAAEQVLDAAEALDELAWLLAATPRTGRESAVVGVGLDRIADVAVLHGPEAAAHVLRAVAGRITSALRSGDLVARLADDHYLVVLRGVHHLRGAIRVANKVRASIEDPIAIPGGQVAQTASVGVTLVSLGEGVDAVLERVDAAVAMAVAVGGNVVRSNPPI